MELRRASTVLGCGCAVVIALFLVAVLTLTWGTYRAGKDFERLTRDPEAAAERAREVVDFGELPEGYPALGALSVPLLLDVAFFMEPPDEGQDGAAGEPTPPPDRGFLYVKLRDWLGRGDELREALGGGAADDAPLDQQGLAFDPSEVVARGRLVVGEAEVQWLARRGNVRIDAAALGGGDRGADDAGAAESAPAGDEPVESEPAGAQPAGAEPAAGEVAVNEVAGSEAAAGETGGRERLAGERAGRPGRRVERRVARVTEDIARATSGDAMTGILSILAFDCPGEDSWHRLGVWYAPDPAPGLPAAEVDWSGGPADPEAIADFLGRFELCG